MPSYPELCELPAVAGKQGWPWTEASPAPPSDGPWPRISIIIPSFNQGHFLEETLRSVLLQAYPDLELIVIDGSSRDSSVDILRRYDAWISYWISEPDGGQPDAINKGFALATGAVITFLASDDIYEPGTLHDVARQSLEHPGCGAIVGAFRFMDPRSRRFPETYPPRLPSLSPLDLTLIDISAWRLHQVATFYTRRALDEVGRNVREELHYTMDRELLYRVCRRFPTVLVERCYAAFRRHPASKSTAQILPMWYEMADLHLSCAPDGESLEARRRRVDLWRERRARGCVKLANSGVSSWVAASALIRALRYRPGLLGRRHYYVSWLGALGLLNVARRAYHSLRRTAPDVSPG